MAHSYNELELTEKGRRALEKYDLDLEKAFDDSSIELALLSILAMTRSGHSISDMVDQAVEISGKNVQEVDNLFESMAHYLVQKGYLRWVENSQDEEPPEAFGEFKDHF